MKNRQRTDPARHLRDIWPRPIEERTELIAIDPGDKYTGVAFFARDGQGGWYCQDAQEFDPHGFEDGLAELLLTPSPEAPPTIVYEIFRLYGDKAQLQTGSEFLTSQTIGVICYLVRVHNEHVARHEEAEERGLLMSCEQVGGRCHDPAFRPQRVSLVRQRADDKKPTRGILNKKKIKSVAGPIARAEYGNRDHIKDAELHGWFHILKTLEEKPSKDAFK
jgi:hypothetical protein